MIFRAAILTTILSLCISPVFPSELQYAGSGLWNNRNAICIFDGYAYCAMTNGIQIVDVDLPENPHVTSQLYLGADATSVTISDEKLYLGLKSGNFQVFEMAGALELLRCSEFAIDHGQIYDIEIRDDLAYVACKAGMAILNISDPCSPFSLSFFPTGRYAVTNLKIVNDTVYACDIDVWVIDVSQPTSPTLITKFEVPMSAWDIDVLDNTAFVSGRDDQQPGFASWLTVLDIANLENPNIISGYGVSSNIYDLDVVDNSLYLAADRNGVLIFDISDLSQLSPVAAVQHTGLSTQVVLQDNLLYVNNMRPITSESGYHSNVFEVKVNSEIDPSGDLVIVDVSDILEPVEVGRLTNPDHVTTVSIHDSLALICSQYHNSVTMALIDDPSTTEPVSMLELPGNPQAAVMDGNYVYVAGLYEGLIIIDVTNPENPMVVGQLDTQGSAVDVKVDGDFAYIADGGNGLGVIDISDPTKPIAVDWHYDGFALRIELKDPILFMSARSAGLKIYDASIPDNLNLLATYPEQSDGGWRTYMAIDNDILCLSSHNFAVEIIDISNPSSPTLITEVYPSREIYELAYKDGLLAMAYAWRGAELFDISDFRSQVSCGRYEIGCALDVGFSDDYLFVADTYSLLRFKLPLTTDVENEPAFPPPTAYSLKQNFPNPFNAETTIEFTLGRRQRVQVHIFNIKGQKVATLLNKTLDPGPHRVAWDGRTTTGRTAASGIYLYQVAGEEESQSKKMLLLK